MTKSPANVAHDAARAEDARRAHAELHAYITVLERDLRERTRERDEAQRERDNARRMCDEAQRERDEWRARAEETAGNRDSKRSCEWEALERCADMKDDLSKVMRERDEARRERDEARAATREAEERGMVRGLEHGLALLWSPEAESAREYAARICAEARAKGGDRG